MASLDHTTGLAAKVASAAALIAGLSLSQTATAAPLVDRINGALDPQACDGQGCWTNHLRVTDLDGDGDLDILLANYADFFNGNNSPEPLVAYLNDGSGSFSNASAAALGDYSGNVRMVAVGDVDGDGAPDLYAPDGAGNAHVLFINDGSGAFTDEADLRLPNDYPQGAAARMADVDGDGDLDIFAADGYASNGPPGHLYINDGSGVFTEAMGAIPGSIEGSDIDDVEFFDADRDFDLDLIVNAHQGGTGALWLNDGTGNFTAETSIDPPATSNFHYNIAPCDVDGDGDLDLWIDNIGGGFREQLLINDGAGNFSDETDARVDGNPGEDDNGVICVDIDDDGDFDAVVVSLGTPERLLENDGSGNFTYVADSFPGPTDCTLWGEFGDLNGDGRLDLVTGQGECSSADEVYLGNMLQPADSQPPRIIAVDAPSMAPADAEVPVTFAVSDRTVTDEGPRLARAYATVDPDGAGTEVEGWFLGGDLFRVMLPGAPSGTVVFQVCAEDRAGNTACSEAEMYEIGGGPGDGDGDGDPGDGDGDGDPGDGDGDGDPGDDTDDSAETGGLPVDGEGGEGGEGCSCTQQSPANAPLGSAGLALLTLAFLRRRR
ncbi:FG-GAP repeat protein [Enhygromyxa salina]|uniref:FG-GAP repeat protein n=1 Tax=Enhygromyxa salina TaxID=215803 RepID=A0A2S9YK26_9BACT|nr:VCBS repeat-containing protein [Enhygromyxa salina]PRQ05454.1 FG-GAP repeat protein [Enhygromyxa salina]